MTYAQPWLRLLLHFLLGLHAFSLVLAPGLKEMPDPEFHDHLSNTVVEFQAEVLL